MRSTTSSRVLMVALASALVLMSGAGCTRGGRDQPPAVSTVGVLKAPDLGPGKWTGPYATLADSPVSGRSTTCGMLGFAIKTTGRRILAQSKVVWVDGDVAVRSHAYLYPDGSDDLKQALSFVDTARDCVHDASTPGPGEGTDFTWEKTDATVVIHEHNHWGPAQMAFDVALTQANSTFIVVEVSYPVGTADPPVLLDLLAKAKTASAELAKTASARSGTPSP
jgi:hypothetical protein